MKTEARLFLGVATFVWCAAIAYGIWSRLYQGHVEVAGVVALILSGGLLAIPGSFFMFVSRRIDARPEDRLDAEIAEGAGDIGFFSPGSYWPFGLGASVALVAFALAFVQVWLVIVGGLIMLFMIGGLLFEYYTGGNSRRIT
jgi:hypothetical protein